MKFEASRMSNVCLTYTSMVPFVCSIMSKVHKKVSELCGDREAFVWLLMLYMYLRQGYEHGCGEGGVVQTRRLILVDLICSLAICHVDSVMTGRSCGMRIVMDVRCR